MDQDGNEFYQTSDRGLLQQAANGEIVLWVFVRRHTAKLRAFPQVESPKQSSRSCAACLVPIMPELANELIAFPDAQLKRYLAVDPSDPRPHPWADHYWALDEPQAIVREQVYCKSKKINCVATNVIEIPAGSKFVLASDIPNWIAELLEPIYDTPQMYSGLMKKNPLAEGHWKIEDLSTDDVTLLADIWTNLPDPGVVTKEQWAEYQQKFDNAANKPKWYLQVYFQDERAESSDRQRKARSSHFNLMDEAVKNKTLAVLTEHRTPATKVEYKCVVPVDGPTGAKTYLASLGFELRESRGSHNIKENFASDTTIYAHSENNTPTSSRQYQVGGDYLTPATGRSDALRSVIVLAKTKAVDPTDNLSVWAALVALAKQESPPSPIIDFVIGQGVRYRVDTGTKALTKKAFLARMDRANSRREATVETRPSSA